MSVKLVLYGLFIVLISGAATAQDLSNAALVSGEPIVALLAGNEANDWLFEGSAGQRIVISAERFPPDPDSELDPLLEVYDAAGHLIATDDDGGPGFDALLIGLTLPQTGAYTIRVSNLTAWAGGTYQLTVADDPFPVDCQSPLGTMIESEMPSTVQGFPVPYRVFLPPCSEGTRLPYVLLMHGSNSDGRLWDQLGIDEAIVRGMTLNRLPPLAVVMPSGGELANTNSFLIGHSWEYVIIDELIPHVEAAYCLTSDRERRAIGGISRGGFWAFLIALRHPDLFGSLGGHSPFFDLYHAPPTHNPLDLSMAAPPNPPLRIWMDRGKDDYAQLNIDLQHDRLLENGIAHEFMLYAAGQHENQYWQTHLDDYLRFYSENWSGLALLPCEGS
jgi:enterochelin esterase-like enzyme